MKPKRVYLEFHPADDPPDVDTTVLLCDGAEVFQGWLDLTYPDGRPLEWVDCTGKPVAGIKSWAHMPAGDECVF